MLAFQLVRVNFPVTAGREQAINSAAIFGGSVRTAHITLNGFDIRFGNGEHPLVQLKIDCNGPSSITGNGVFFSVNVLMRDSSGNIDDPFGGYVDVLVIADLL